MQFDLTGIEQASQFSGCKYPLVEFDDDGLHVPETYSPGADHRLDSRPASFSRIGPSHAAAAAGGR